MYALEKSDAAPSRNMNSKRLSGGIAVFRAPQIPGLWQDLDLTGPRFADLRIIRSAGLRSELSGPVRDPEPQILDIRWI